MFTGSNNNSLGEGVSIQGWQSHSTGGITYSRISNGKVSMPTWLVNTNDGFTSVRYSGDDTVSGGLNIFEIISTSPSQLDIFVTGIFSVPFTNGSATISKNNAASWTEYK